MKILVEFSISISLPSPPPPPFSLHLLFGVPMVRQGTAENRLQQMNNLHSIYIIKLKPWHWFAWKGSWLPSYDLFLHQMNSESHMQRQINCSIFQISVKACGDGRIHSRVAGLFYCSETKTVVEDNTSQQKKERKFLEKLEQKQQVTGETLRMWKLLKQPV